MFDPEYIGPLQPSKFNYKKIIICEFWILKEIYKAVCCSILIGKIVYAVSYITKNIVKGNNFIAISMDITHLSV